jgi:hypothetical protein
MKCATCGAESPLEDLFVRQPFSKTARFLCQQCDLRSRRKLAKMIVLGSVLAAIVLLFEILFTNKLTDDPQSLQIGEFVVLFAVFQILCIVPHELAHAVAAWLVGFPVNLISLGRGELLASWKTGAVRCEVRVWPMCGIVGVTYPPQRAGRFRRIVFVAAAPLVNLLIALAAIRMAGSPAAVFAGNSMNAAKVAWWALASANCMLCLGALWPAKGTTSLGQRKSDGSQLLELIFGVAM